MEECYAEGGPTENCLYELIVTEIDGAICVCEVMAETQPEDDFLEYLCPYLELVTYEKVK